MSVTIPSLFNLCVRVIGQHVHRIKSVTSVPTHLTQILLDTVVSYGLLTDASLLKFLEARGITNLNLQNISLLTSSVLNEIARYPGLLQLNLKNCRQLNLNSAVSIVQNCTRIQSINFSGCHQVNDRVLQAISESYISQSLNSALFSGCYEITSTGAKFLAACRNMREIDLSYIANIDHPSLRHIAEGCQRLEVINLRYCSGINDNAIHSFAQRCHSLKEIDLYGCKEISDASINAIANSCKKLERLNIGECPRITDRSAMNITQYTSFVNYLNFSGDSSLTDLSARAIGVYGKKLKSLIVKRCTFLTDDGVLHIAKGCPIEILDLDGCGNISGKSAEVIAGIRTLQELDISYCRNIPYTSILGIVSRCPLLKRIALWGHPLNPSQLSELRLYNAGLDIKITL